MRCRFTPAHSRSAPRAALCALTAALALLVAGGCVRRTITITSDPPGALCWLNGREVGRTPVTVDFLFYGIYDVQLTKDGYEPLVTTGDAVTPWWDTIPLDLGVEALPGEPHSDLRWHYTLQPLVHDRAALLDRAEALRHKLETEAPIPPGSPETMPATTAPAGQPSKPAAPATTPGQ